MAKAAKKTAKETSTFNNIMAASVRNPSVDTRFTAKIDGLTVNFYKQRNGSYLLVVNKWGGSFPVKQNKSGNWVVFPDEEQAPLNNTVNKYIKIFEASKKK